MEGPRAFYHVGFFCFTRYEWQAAGTISMQRQTLTMAQQVAQAASAFQLERTGHTPKAVTAVLSEETIVIILAGAFSPAEEALAKSPAGAAQLQEFHRQLFANSCEPLRQEIKRITGVAVRDSAAVTGPSASQTAPLFTSDGMLQVFLLAQSIPVDAWNGNGPISPR